jgi:Big-like domain-containing protein
MVVAKSLITTQTIVASTVNPALAGQAVTFVASVTGTSGVPSGIVTFCDGTTTLGVAALDATGHAAFTVSTLSVGNHSITAIYGGSANCAGSQGAMSQAVIAAQGAGPRVVQFQRFGYHWMPTVLVLAFDSPLDARSAQNTANYRITGPGGRPIGIGSVVYNASARTVTIYPSERLNIHWTYALQVNGTTANGVRGADGALLNAAGAGLPGHDYQTLVTFSNVVFP